MIFVPNKMPMYRNIATTLQAYQNCMAKPDAIEWENRHHESLNTMVRNFLPSGSGVDNGCTLDFNRSYPDKLIIHTSFHHMNEGGCYDGWTEHTITVRPSLTSKIDLKISGKDRNNIKEYLHDLFYEALTKEIEL